MPGCTEGDVPLALEPYLPRADPELLGWQRKGEGIVKVAIDPATTAELLALLAHDLRNPLSALHSNVGYLAAMLEGVEQDIVEALADARVSCDSLVTIIDNLELLGRALGEAPNAGRTKLGLGTCVEAVVAQHAGLAQSHGTAIALEPVDAALHVESNREMLGRALGNLICNAIQYSQPGQPITVKAHARGRECVVTVADSGPTMNEQVAERAFSAAGQSELKGLPAGRYGRGLGLLAARLAADAACASVRVRRSGEQGNAFELVFARSAQS